MVALLLVAVALGVSNLVGAVGIGMAGVGGRARLRVGVIFGVFEAGMPVLGLLLGRGLAHGLGHATRWIGAVLLVIVGGYTAIQAARHRADGPAAPAGAGGLRTGRLTVTGLALSIDNLAVGFALGAYRVNLIVAVCVIGAVSVTLSLVGLELGDRLGARIVNRGELAGGLVLVGVGVALATGVL